MNILFNCSEYPPFRNGGIGSVTKIVAEELVSRGNSVYVVGYYTDLNIREKIEVVNGVTIFRYNYKPNRTSLQSKIRMYRNKFRMLGKSIQKELDFYEDRIGDIINKYNIDILELTDFYHFNVYRTKLKFRRFNVPTIIRVHGSESFMLYNSGKNYGYALRNDKCHFSRAEYLVSVSKYSQRYVDMMMPDVVFKEKRVIYNPIENSFIQHNEPSSSKIILYIGKLIKTKGAYNIIKAFNRIAEEYAEWELHMLGTGDQSLANAYVSDVAKGRVIMHGFCNRQEVASKIDECSFACIPTFFENFSMVTIEIMGRSKAVIFTERTSGKEIINNGIDGYTVNPENIEDIYYSIKQLIENKSIRDSFAEEGYKKVLSHFSANRVVDELELFYHSII